MVLEYFVGYNILRYLGVSIWSPLVAALACDDDVLFRPISLQLTLRCSAAYAHGLPL